MVDLNNLTDREAEDVATRTLWNALPKPVQATVAAGMTPEQRAEVRKAIGRAKKVAGS